MAILNINPAVRVRFSGKVVVGGGYGGYGQGGGGNNGGGGGGVDVNKNGAYSDGYYVSGVINTNYNNLTPQQAIDTIAHPTYGYKGTGNWYYKYTNGVASMVGMDASDSYYSNGAFFAGDINEMSAWILGDAATNALQAVDNGLYYYYANSFASKIPELANGSYGNGTFINGVMQ